MEEKEKNKVAVHKAVITAEEKDKNLTVTELLFEWAGAVFVSIIIVMLTILCISNVKDTYTPDKEQ